MDIGQRLRQVRLAAGLSQRELCGDKITRNMLSQIENGTARPSMDTLCYLAQRLGVGVGNLLEESSPMEQARDAYAAGEYDRAAELAQGGWEGALLKALCCMELAERAIDDGKLPYALRLLEQAGELRNPYFGPELERRRLLLLGRAGERVTLPSDDQALLLRARWALDRGDARRAMEYLAATEDRDALEWHLLEGRSLLALECFEEAKPHFEKAEPMDPKGCAAALEQCCQALEDYKGAYYYACKLREYS